MNKAATGVERALPQPGCTCAVESRPRATSRQSQGSCWREHAPSAYIACFVHPRNVSRCVAPGFSCGVAALVGGSTGGNAAQRRRQRRLPLLMANAAHPKRKEQAASTAKPQHNRQRTARGRRATEADRQRGEERRRGENEARHARREAEQKRIDERGVEGGEKGEARWAGAQ